jgi:metal-responsive CopG/Arc/MetJ family transcriptional regulator
MKVHTEGLLPVNVLIPASLLRELDEAAKERQLSRTGLVRLLAANEVARQRAQRSDLQDNRPAAA